MRDPRCNRAASAAHDALQLLAIAAIAVFVRMQGVQRNPAGRNPLPRRTRPGRNLSRRQTHHSPDTLQDAREPSLRSDMPAGGDYGTRGRRHPRSRLCKGVHGRRKDIRSARRDPENRRREQRRCVPSRRRHFAARLLSADHRPVSRLFGCSRGPERRPPFQNALLRFGFAKQSILCLKDFWKQSVHAAWSHSIHVLLQIMHTNQIRTFYCAVET